MNCHPSAQRALARVSRSRFRSLVGPCAVLIAAVLWLPGAATADSISLSVTREPIEELTSQITFQAVAEASAFAAVYINVPGIPCAPDPEADEGTAIVSPEIWTLPSAAGQFEGSGNYTPPSSGGYTMCGWVIRYDPSGVANSRGVITASSATPLDVRAPKISLALSLPRPAQLGKSFAVNARITSEVPRELVVEEAPSGSRRCPVNPSAGSGEHLIDTEIDGGPWVKRLNVEPLPAGRQLFCAWADRPGDNGLEPQRHASLTVTVSRAKHRHARHRHSSRTSGTRCSDLSTCQHGGGPFGP
jgi:hypothetical protein